VDGLLSSYVNEVVEEQVALAMNVHEHSLVAASTLQQLTPVEELGERASTKPVRHWGVYASPTGSFGTIQPVSNQVGSSYNTLGAMVGFDYAFTREHHDTGVAWGLGSTLQYTHFHVTADQNSGSTLINQFYAQLYGTVLPKTLEELSFNGMVSWGYDWYGIKRTGLGPHGLTASGSPHGMIWDALLGVEYMFGKRQFPCMGNWRIEPLATLQYAWLGIDGYTEQGEASYTLRYKDSSNAVLWTILGTRVNYAFNPGSDFVVRPEISAGWQYQYLNEDTSVAFSTVNAPFPFSDTVVVAGPDRNSLVAAANLKLVFHHTFSVLFEYDVTYNNLILDNEFNLRFKWEF
jgi:outer membrane autotransporter protein